MNWVAKERDRRRKRHVVMALALRYFAGQNYKTVAEEAGLTTSTLQSFYYYVELPRDRHRSKFGHDYDADTAQANLERSGYELVVCPRTGFLFFRRKKDRAVQRFCRQVRREMGLISEFDRYRSAELCL